MKRLINIRKESETGKKRTQNIDMHTMKYSVHIILVKKKDFS